MINYTDTERRAGQLSGTDQLGQEVTEDKYGTCQQNQQCHTVAGFQFKIQEAENKKSMRNFKPSIKRKFFPQVKIDLQ